MNSSIKTYAQGVVNIVEIWVDRRTGVNYLFHANGNASGLTPLLDREGRGRSSQRYMARTE